MTDKVKESMTSNLYNIYCDESCYLEHDQHKTMGLGAIICPRLHVPIVSKEIRKIKKKYGFKKDFEPKWSKISPAKQDFYRDLVNLFLEDNSLSFRGLIIPNKSILKHDKYGQSHDDWYYKMYYTMLNPILYQSRVYSIYLDIKDTRGGPRTRELHDVLANSKHDFQHQMVTRIQQIRSHESELLPLADLLIGALTYFQRNLHTSKAKETIISRLQECLGESVLSHNSNYSETKFNLLVWRPKEYLK